MIGVTVLGSTGSIGISTLDVLARHRERFKVVALTANNDDQTLFAQCLEHRPDFAVLLEETSAARLRERLKESRLGTRVLCGADALAEMAALPHVDYVMAAIVGAAGLLPAMAAARAGKRVLLANKEALVLAGHWFMETVRRHGAELIPIDSEHNAVFQCLPDNYRVGEPLPGISRIWLTASGGPFRDWPVERLADATPDQACAHPNWVMGRKISVDSATMMNKGLEVIEACWLFDLKPEQVQVVLHPQSVIHSMVEYVDGSLLAQLGNPDMRTPIAHALACPERMESGVPPLNPLEAAKLEFREPDPARFPCLGLAYDALRMGGAMPAVLNAANEIAVAAFLAGTARFTDIYRTIAAAVQHFTGAEARDFEHVMAVDKEVRAWTGARLSGAAT